MTSCREGSKFAWAALTIAKAGLAVRIVIAVKLIMAMHAQQAEEPEPKSAVEVEFVKERELTVQSFPNLPIRRCSVQLEQAHFGSMVHQSRASCQLFERQELLTWEQPQQVPSWPLLSEEELQTFTLSLLL